MKKNSALLIFLLIAAPLFAQSPAQKQAIQTLVEKQLTPDIPGVLLHVESGDRSIEGSYAAGISDKISSKELLPEQTFRIASVTKTFVAASILRLWEEGKLKLEDPISRYISAEHAKILSKDYDLEKISLLQTLRHNAGFFDHTYAPEFFEKVQQPGGHVWTRTEQLQLCVDAGEPIGAPGEKFGYSDTGYILLGEVIENISGKPLGVAIPEILDFQKLELKNTAFEGLDPKVDNA